MSLFLAFILALVTAVFALQNTEAVTVRFVFWEYQTSLVLVILGSAAVGGILAYLASLRGRWRRSSEIRKLSAAAEAQATRIEALNEEVRRLPKEPH